MTVAGAALTPMSTADNFLNTAQKLYGAGEHEGDWRRIISTAYYAAFHCLIENGSPLVFAQEEAVEEGRRWFKHNEMYRVADSIASSPRPEDEDKFEKWLKKQGMNIGFTEYPGESIVAVCRDFAELKRAREKADYFPTRAEGSITKSQAAQALAQAMRVCENLPQLIQGSNPEFVKVVMAMLKKPLNPPRSRS